MSARIPQQQDPNTSNQLVHLEEDGEATAGELPWSTISKDLGKSKKQWITINHSPTAADPQVQFPTPLIFQDPPTFHPVIARYHPHTAYNTLPSIIHWKYTVEPCNIIRLSLTQSLLEDMAANTNAYAAAEARKQQRQGGRKWKAVSASELGVWSGIVLYMRVHNSPPVKDYRRHDGLNTSHPICKYMGQTWFEVI